MFARVTPFEIDTVRIPLGEAERLFEDLVVPRLRQQPGLEGFFVMRTKEGKGLVLTLWSSERAAMSNVESGYYEEQVNQFVAFMREPPGREQYEVIFDQMPVERAGTAR